MYNRCYLGKRRLENAIKQYQSKNPNVEFKIYFLPYQLSPYTKRPKNKLEYYHRKFGGKEQFEEFNNRFKEMTRPLGIQINFNGVISNTLDSHRLIWWSHQFQKQSEVVEQLCKLYFEENKDIGDHDALAAAGVKAGLDKQKTLDFLKSTEGTEAVQDLIKANTSNDVTGVPHYSFNNR